MIKYYTELNFKKISISLFSSSQINPPCPCVVSGGSCYYLATLTFYTFYINFADDIKQAH